MLTGMATMAGKAFADTNIVLRLVNEGLPEHDAVNQFIDQLRKDEYELWISRQVIREYLVQVTRSGFLASVIPVKQVLTQIETIRTLFRIADETDAATSKLLDLIEEFPTG
ncbi:MAG: hypothetical protein U0521_25100 [Anaerolineae bacterium]